MIARITASAIAEARASVEKEAQAAVSNEIWAYREAAAVLTTFDPDTIQPFLRNSRVLKSRGHGAVHWTTLLEDCEAIRSTTNAWRLRDRLRRQTLRRLGTAEMLRSALEANPARSKDIAQNVFEQILLGHEFTLEFLSREQLSALSMVSEWTRDILPNIPDEFALRRAIPRAELLAPFRRLADSGFVGRDREMKRLDNYVLRRSRSLFEGAGHALRHGIEGLRSQPPLMVTGPGGVGKSTLLARFVLKHLERSKTNLTFIYLDLDRATCDPERPHTLLAEAARQLGTQLPYTSEKVSSFVDQLDHYARSVDRVDTSRNVDQLDAGIEEFASLVKETPGPALLIIDTFEEAQFLGNDIVQNLLVFVSKLQVSIPAFRTVLAGRGDIDEGYVDIIRLGDLTRTESLNLLKILLPKAGPAVRGEIVESVGSNPLSLRLAARIVEKSNIAELESIESRSWLFHRLRAETIQGRLYGRMLAHIHDPDVKKIAFPGLLVRRITPEIVVEVLAGPCMLTIPSLSDAQQVTDALAAEATLVFRDPADGALCHRPDVRKAMIADLGDQIPKETAAEIHANAVAYYGRFTAPRERAEEIYHRLHRGDAFEEVKRRWTQGVEPFLRTAVDEFTPAVQLWLSRQLGITPTKKLLEKADQTQWEELAAVSARRYLAAGDAKRALATIGKRRDRSPGSPLYAVEVEALMTLGDYSAAERVIKTALSEKVRSGSTQQTVDLLMQASAIAEARSALAEAQELLFRAQALLSMDADPLRKFRLHVTQLRLLRKIDRSAAAIATFQSEALRVLTSEFVIRLRGRPSILREAAAELAHRSPALMEAALETLGLELLDSDARQALAAALFVWDHELSAAEAKEPLEGEYDFLPSAVTTGRSQLAMRAGIYESTPEAWLEFVEKTKPVELVRSVLNWRAVAGSTAELELAICETYQAAVDAALLPGRAGKRSI